MRTTLLFLFVLATALTACRETKKPEAPKPAIAWLASPSGQTDTLKSVTLSPDSSALSVLFDKAELRVADKLAHDSSYSYTLTIPAYLIPKGQSLVAHARYAALADDKTKVQLSWLVPGQRSTPEASKPAEGDKALATFRIVPTAGQNLVWKLTLHVHKPAGSGEVLFQWDSLDLASEK